MTGVQTCALPISVSQLQCHATSKTSQLQCHATSSVTVTTSRHEYYVMLFYNVMSRIQCHIPDLIVTGVNFVGIILFLQMLSDLSILSTSTTQWMLGSIAIAQLASCLSTSIASSSCTPDLPHHKTHATIVHYTAATGLLVCF